MKVWVQAILCTFIRSYTPLYNFKHFYCDPEHFYTIPYHALVFIISFLTHSNFIKPYYLTKDTKQFLIILINYYVEMLLIYAQSKIYDHSSYTQLAIKKFTFFFI